MLVLSRKKEEQIIINDDITITVVEIRGDKVRLGFTAPKHVAVHRREIYEAIQANQSAATTLAGSLGLFTVENRSKHLFSRAKY